MARPSQPEEASACVNDRLGDDELRAVLSKLDLDKDKEVFGLVCKRWLHLQSTERRKLCARAGPHMLKRMAVRFTRLSELDLSQSVSRSFFPGVTDSDLSVIAAAFSALRVLNLHNCKGITDKGMSAIGSGLPHLQSVDVSYCRKLTDKGLSPVATNCHDLRSFHAAGCRFITDALLTALSTNCNNLEDLNLQGCSNLTDSGLTRLVSGCNRLKHLDLNKCSNIGDIGVSNVSTACSSSLVTLKLLDCYKIGDVAILSLAQHCKNLEMLVIGGCRDVTDESIRTLASACCRGLKNLRMDWCLNVSDNSLECVFGLCEKLEVVDVGCCEEVTDGAFRGLGNESSLKVLRVSNCPKITVDGIGRVLRACEGLEYVDVRSCPFVTEARCREVGLVFPMGCKVNFVGSLAEPDVLR
ncbi:F-box/LRR-repeat protein 4 [Phtheirospermum japonicum]|uniref:F-box/LRR-repeat protein 4 n=1 Tax=Phtheirospermum japonicum TaxID=374723 RepID=A0A830CT66_9LAMI|nr:F-box/LRR-repeat protein 4 [Phtheirospermum japonicum]